MILAPVPRPRSLDRANQHRKPIGCRAPVHGPDGRRGRGGKMVFVDGNAERIPNYSDGVVRLTGFASDDVEAHLEGEDEETARRFGWWPNSSTAETVLRAFDEWAAGWRRTEQSRPSPCAARRPGNWSGLPVAQAIRRQRRCRIGRARHRGRGFAQRALGLLCCHAAGGGLDQPLGSPCGRAIAHRGARVKPRPGNLGLASLGPGRSPSPPGGANHDRAIRLGEIVVLCKAGTSGDSTRSWVAGGNVGLQEAHALPQRGPGGIAKNAA